MAVGARPRDVLAQFLGEARSWRSAAGRWAPLASRRARWRSAPPLAGRVPGGGGVGSLALALATGLGGGHVPARRASLVAPSRRWGA